MTSHSDTESSSNSAPVGQPQPSPRQPEMHTHAVWPWWSIASLVMLTLIVLAAVGGSVAFALRKPPPVVWPTTALVTITPLPGPTYIVVTSVAPTPVTWPNITRSVRVADTQGLSLRIRSTPGSTGETVKLVPDGTRLIVTGDGREVEGSLWWPVRDPSDNQEGWAVSTFLVSDTGP